MEFSARGRKKSRSSVAVEFVHASFRPLSRSCVLKKCARGRSNRSLRRMGCEKKNFDAWSLSAKKQSEIAARFARVLLPSVFAPRAKPNQPLEPTSGLRPAVAHL